MPKTFTIGTGAGGAGTTQTQISARLGLVEGTQLSESLVLNNPNSPIYVQVMDLASGFNAIDVPPLAGGVIIEPPELNAETLVLKGETGDTGIALSLLAPIVLTFPAVPPATIGLTASDAIVGMRFHWL